MSLRSTLETIIRSNGMALSPQELRDVIKKQYPELYGTEADINNVRKGHYKDLDHALLARIYTTVGSGSHFVRDTSFKPMRINTGETAPTRPVTRGITFSPKPPAEENSRALIGNLRYYYRKSIDVMHDFGGPSIYFHVEALKAAENEFLGDRHLEMIYAVLTAWGMHKMGDPRVSRAKLRPFNDFRSSIMANSKTLYSLKDKRMDLCPVDEYEAILKQLETTYYHLPVSISEATIVANSKTLAHILPHLIPPVDRQYTIRFFTQSPDRFISKKGSFSQVNLPSDIETQFEDFRKYCLGVKAICDSCDRSLFSIDKESFNTSIPKIIDNLIMAFVKDKVKGKVN